MLETANNVDKLRQIIADWRMQGNTVAFVPTMGALHAGHVSLGKIARARARRVIYSIFVNPTQFAPTEDLSRYPRDLKRDLANCRKLGVDVENLLISQPAGGEPALEIPLRAA